MIGSGVGRVLYRHVMAEATRLGFDRVTIESDPHAEPFHLAMGAERTSSGRQTIDRWADVVSHGERPEPVNRFRPVTRNPIPRPKDRHSAA